jgi:phage-related protein
VWVADRMPLVSKLSDDIWEMRCALPSRRTARLLFATDGQRILVLHGFIKQTQKTPPNDIALARRRLRETLS